MYLPDHEVERVATSLITEFGESAVQETRARAALARASGLYPTALVWERILERIVQLQNDSDEDFREAC